MTVPAGYSELGRIGFVDKGNYSASVTYRTGDTVYYNGSTWVALTDNLTGVTPAPGASWKYMARGFLDELLSLIKATDTSGVLGTAGAEVSAQSLIDAIADRVMTKLLYRSQIVDNCVTNNGSLPLSAAQGKTLMDKYTQLNSEMTLKTASFESNIFGSVSVYKMAGSANISFARNKIALTSGQIYNVAILTSEYCPKYSITAMVPLGRSNAFGFLSISPSGEVALTPYSDIMVESYTYLHHSYICM